MIPKMELKKIKNYIVPSLNKRRSKMVPKMSKKKKLQIIHDFLSSELVPSLILRRTYVNEGLLINPEQVSI